MNSATNISKPENNEIKEARANRLAKLEKLKSFLERDGMLNKDIREKKMEEARKNPKRLSAKSDVQYTNRLGEIRQTLKQDRITNQEIKSILKNTDDKKLEAKNALHDHCDELILSLLKESENQLAKITQLQKQLAEKDKMIETLNKKLATA